MLWITITVCVIWIVAAIWAMLDALDNTDYGCLWALLFIFLGPPALIAYLFLRFYATRPVSQRVLREREMERGEGHSFRFPREIEKARFIEAAGRGHGTLYDPDVAAPPSPQGYAHFTDHRAEALISQRRYDEAWDYLIDMYAVARGEQDSRGADTYRHYIARLPQGPHLLSKWLAGEKGAPPAPKPPKQRGRDVPF